MARRGRGPRIPKPPRKKAASYTLVDPGSEQGKRVHSMLNVLIEEHHGALTNARFAVAWNHTWKPDADGRVTLGQLKKASDLDRELRPFDFVVLLRHDFWTSPVVDDAKRIALLDHQLCHADVKRDKASEPVTDEKGRTIYRTIKHDIEEFSAVVDRHGRYTRDLENFYAAMKRGGVQKELFEDPPKAAAGKVGPTPQQQLHAVATAAGEPKPSEPHAFEPTGEKGLAKQMCKHCGSGEQDPVHESTSGTVPGVGDVTVAGPGAKEIVARMTGNGKGHGPIARARKVAKGKGRKRPEARA